MLIKQRQLTPKEKKWSLAVELYRLITGQSNIPTRDRLYTLIHEEGWVWDKQNLKWVKQPKK